MLWLAEVCALLNINQVGVCFEPYVSHYYTQDFYCYDD